MEKTWTWKPDLIIGHVSNINIAIETPKCKEMERHAK